MEEERVVLKQQKVQLNLLCAWNSTDPFGTCHFPQFKVPMQPLGAFQRTRTQTASAYVKNMLRFVCHPTPSMGRGAARLSPHKSVTVEAHNTPQAFSLCACFSFHPPEEQSQAERSSKSALLRRRKRYFNSAVNKFCPFTCVRNTLNKLCFQDLAPLTVA